MKTQAARTSAQKDAPNDSSGTPPALDSDLTIVTVGASAGGMEAFSELMNVLPADTDMAFALVQHLDP